MKILHAQETHSHSTLAIAVPMPTILSQTKVGLAKRADKQEASYWSTAFEYTEVFRA